MKAQRIWFDETYIYLETDTQKKGKMPLNWFPKLRNATHTELQDYELWANQSWIHWENLCEDLSVEGFFTYQGGHI